MGDGSTTTVIRRGFFSLPFASAGELGNNGEALVVVVDIMVVVDAAVCAKDTTMLCTRMLKTMIVSHRLKVPSRDRKIEKSTRRDLLHRKPLYYRNGIITNITIGAAVLTQPVINEDGNRASGPRRNSSPAAHPTKMWWGMFGMVAGKESSGAKRLCPDLK
eukprot:scaffold2215_cov162-Amphora_coffeaeformis.AAC.1